MAVQAGMLLRGAACQELKNELHRMEKRKNG